MYSQWFNCQIKSNKTFEFTARLTCTVSGQIVKLKVLLLLILQFKH